MAPRSSAVRLIRWSDWPLNRLFSVLTAIVVAFLALVLALGLRQSLLYHQCRQAVSGGDRLLFQFTALKDHLSESVMLDQQINLRAFDGELQGLETEIADLQGNILIPEGLKAALPTRVDLVGLEVRLRSIQEQRQQQPRERAELISSLNRTNLALQQFHLQLSDHTRNVLLGLHRIIIGALALIAALACTLLFLLNRHLAVPVFSLCRKLVNTLEGSEENTHSCSFATLTGRLGDLLDQAATRQPPSGANPPMTADQLQQETLRYRYAILGSWGGELASELTNRLNGVINYTQTLIDLSEQRGSHQQTAELMRLLIGEEQRTADLVLALQRMGRWQGLHSEAWVNLAAFFPLVALICDKPLRAESIRLTLPAACRHEVAINAGDLWLVLLTLLQQGRRALSRHLPDNREEQQLTVEWYHPAGQPRLCLTLSNSAGAWETDDNNSIWPSRTFITELLQHHHAILSSTFIEQNESTVQEERLIIELSCRTSVA